MLIKHSLFAGQTASGIFCQGLFGSAGAFEKTAGAPPFADWETGDELRRFIGGIGREQRQKNCYVLVNALGAGEFFGSNINADYFPWNALCHEGDDYGYKTFLRANAFAHHVNKDPLKGFGKPVLSLINPSMKRVELLCELDRSKAKHEGHDGVIVRIDKGEFPDVSMGCKVPYDVCSICSNRSKTRDDYCEHMRPGEDKRHVYGPNKILPDGRKIFVYNLHPRFFDISFVFIGADKTAKVMAKVASAPGGQVTLGPISTKEKVASVAPAGLEKTASTRRFVPAPRSRPSELEGLDKLASAFGVKQASRHKLAEMVKNVPTGAFASSTLPELEKYEPSLPPQLLKEMGSRPPSAACSSAGMLGIILQPREFQRIILVRIGEGGLADDLDRKCQCFRQVKGFDDSIPYGKEHQDAKLLELLKEHVSGRSGFAQPLAMRGMRKMSMKKALPTEARVEHPLLDKVSAAYNGYRRSMLMKLSQAVGVIESDPKLRELVLGDSLANMFMKTSSASTLSLDSIAFFTGAHFQDRSLLSNTAVAEAVAVSNEGLLDVEGLSPA